ncbi:hypothetical protein [Flavobacterium capsici]|uniref:Uncharacterized protein n=1 Tax=Flavobacterium capsici TaxID=3075618 RepID=A0AA96J3G3_9FLAO|nr:MULTISPECIES: hypothetical protein [unclassified Flavobacterium]WNM19263.1 hypothetical protein RN608_00940 [Flavobacterium sp. PMR2A8]WNM20652.1 hypothetical protein RN605_08110 [Flavobacterium sp. PMTSA4]
MKEMPKLIIAIGKNHNQELFKDFYESIENEIEFVVVEGYKDDEVGFPAEKIFFKESLFSKIPSKFNPSKYFSKPKNNFKIR